MPLYEYQCRKCGQTFELLRGMKDADDRLKCPHCRSTKVERQFSSFAAGGCGSGGSGKFT
jgi:putative FmdB family regulatory protein